jgi:FMN phosphatase YigB (HAD superfamily)
MMRHADWLADIKVVIFDMDGTLYQEDTFMDRYIRYLLEETEWAHEVEAAIAAARKLLSGTHRVRFGHFYHKADDIVLIQEGGRFVEGFTWEGAALSAQQVEEAYGTILATSRDLLYIGDPWGVVGSLRHKYKLPEEKVDAAFRRIREEMIVAPYRFECDTSLFRTIRELEAVERKVLMTNTYEQSGLDFLRHMQILPWFDEVYCGADKPYGMRSYLDSLLAQGYRSHEMLSIGDNPWNDLYPVKQRGGRTCFISPYPSAETETWDVRLHTLNELAELLSGLQAARSGVQSAIS